MICPIDPNGIHRLDPGADYCRLCRAPGKNLVESQHQPMREIIRAKEGVGAYGRTAERAAVDIARRRAGDDE